MTNEEKKQYLIDLHALLLKHRPYDNGLSEEEAKNREEAFWNDFHANLYPRLPKAFYKYRNARKNSIESFEKEMAWYSQPNRFDDTTDFVINADIESQLEAYEANPTAITKMAVLGLIKSIAARHGISIDMEELEKAIPLFTEDGRLNAKETRLYLSSKMKGSKGAVGECMSQISSFFSSMASKKIEKAMADYLKAYFKVNAKLRKDTLSLCLAEEEDIQAMWGLYANCSKGFCIRYVFPPDSTLGKRMLLNLYPIYYGEKPKVDAFGVLNRGLQRGDDSSWLAEEDERDWFVSVFTKDESYSFQKEWRITFDKRFGGNLQGFPFATAIILGERVREDKKEALIKVAKKLGLEIYARELSKTGSKVITTKIG